MPLRKGGAATGGARGARATGQKLRINRGGQGYPGHLTGSLRPDPAASRGTVIRLTPGGLDAQRLYCELAATIERGWHERFADGAITALRASLEPLAAPPGGGPPPLFQGLEPHPDNWRASVRRPATLPHYPMILHRGGYPDGS